MVVYIHSTIFDCGPGALVLCQQAFLAGEAHFYLSALGHQRKLRLAMVVSVGCGSGDRDALVGSKADWAGSADCGAIFCRHTFPRAWIRKYFSVSLFVRCRPFSIPRRRRPDRSRRGWVDSIASVYSGRLAGLAGCTHLETSRHLSGPRNIVARYLGKKSGFLDGTEQFRRCFNAKRTARRSYCSFAKGLGNRSRQCRNTQQSWLCTSANGTGRGVLCSFPKSSGNRTQPRCCGALRLRARTSTEGTRGAGDSSFRKGFGNRSHLSPST